MVFLKQLLARIRPTPRSINQSLGHEDVESDWLNLQEQPAAGGDGDGGDAFSSPEAHGLRDLSAARGHRVEPDLAGDRPPAALPIPDSEMRSIETGEWGAHHSERDIMLQQLNELGYNLKRVLADVCQMQQVVASDFASLTDADKCEARAYIEGLSALVLTDESAQRAA
jgi:hypothetical protein